jgi:hypothetical protein
MFGWNNIKVEFDKISCEDVNWIGQYQAKIQ